MSRLHARFSVPARAGAHADRQIVRGERGRLMLASALAQPSNLHGPRRADQRSRHRDARSLAGIARRLCRHDPYRQPRPRFSRSRRDLGDRRRRGRALGRICGRLFRHGRPARAGPCRSARRATVATPERRRTIRPAGGTAAPRRKLGFNEMRALDPLPRRIEKLRADLDALERKLADADFPVREPAAFTARRRLMRICATRSPGPRTNGSGSRSCARSSSGSRAHR